ncbi:hypothetical protein GCM10009119_40060 [Algoriphagus jejuensis]|uniref:Uncharacterized protein n=1 Tax=Algoriphagus jejuensis TaxID=419934 RepID=A0ABP3YHK7_9BACT
MNPKKNDPLDSMKRWVTEVGMDTPREDFHLSVLKKIETLPPTTDSYQPVIAPLGWKMILVFISSIVAWTIFSSPDSREAGTLLDKFPQLKLPMLHFDAFDINFPTLDLSIQFQLGLAIFFIMSFLVFVSKLRDNRAGA